MRSLNQDACAIAGIGFATASATVIEVQENAERLTNDIVGFSAFDIDEETDTANEKTTAQAESDAVEYSLSIRMERST